MLKAMSLGASAVVLDTMLAHTEEAPGNHFYREGVRVKLAHPPAQLAGKPGVPMLIPRAVVAEAFGPPVDALTKTQIQS